MKSVFQSKKVIIVFGIAIFLVAGIILSIATIGSGKGMSIRDNLELGEKYLSELKYEDAMLAFTEVIQVEPNNMTATLGIADSYLGLNEEEKAVEILEQGIGTIKQVNTTENIVLEDSDEIYIRRADILIAQGDLDGGIQLLEDGYALTYSERINDILKQYKTWLEETKDTATVSLSENEKTELNTLISYFDTKNLDSVLNVLSGDTILNLYKRTRGNSPYYYDGEKLSDTLGENGLVIFHYENIASTLVYYGDIYENQLNGEGIIFESWDGLNDDGTTMKGYSYYSGSWLEGKSNGQGETGMVKQTDGMTVSEITKGSYLNGLENGSMEIQSKSDNKTQRYHYNIREGYLEPGDNISLDDATQEYIIFSDDESYGYYVPVGQIRIGWDISLETIRNY